MLMNFTNQLLKKLIKEKYIRNLKIIYGGDLADMKSLNRKNKDIKYLLCVIELFSNYAFVVPLKDKKGISIVNAFDKIIKQSSRRAKGTSAQHVKPNKIWIDQGSEFYNHVFFLKNVHQTMILLCIQLIMKVNQ